MPSCDPQIPYLTTLSFSGGRQSSCILWKVLRDEIAIPRNFVVLTADPGMESSKTYPYIKMMLELCDKKGIENYVVEGRNLYLDLLDMKWNVNHPPYWTKSADGKKTNRLLQQCTDEYKIRPMQRKIRQLLWKKMYIHPKSKQLWTGTVESWIGFSYDEVFRIKPSRQKYISFRYPLIELRMETKDVVNYFTENNLPSPPRSACNACFAHGLATFKDMYLNRPDDWKQAVAIDNAVRDFSRCSVKDPVYVSKTCIPLEELAKMDFKLADKKDDNDKWSCDSGFCFV